MCFQLGTNSLKAEGLKAILKNFKDPDRIDDLDISNNEIEEKEEIVTSIAEHLLRFKNLVQINLTGIAYNQIMLDKIIAMCKSADMSCRIIIGTFKKSINPITKILKQNFIYSK